MTHNNKPKVVVIGGGTGVSNVLSEFKNFFQVTAVVSMMDSGGSSGRLRDEGYQLKTGHLWKGRGDGETGRINSEL